MNGPNDIAQGSDPYAPPSLPWRLSISLFAVALVLFFSYTFVAHYKFLHVLSKEGGVVENSQFLAFLATSVISAWVVLRSWKRRDYAVALPYALFAMGCFFIAAEEISWGQRIIEYQLPERFLAINAQKEASFHNIKPVQKKIFHIYALVAGLACLSSVVRLLPALRRHRILRYYSVHPVCFAYFFPALAYGCFRMAYGPYWRRLQRSFGQELAKEVSILQEPVELGIALGFLLIAVIALLNSRAEQTDQKPAPSATSNP